MSAPPLAPEEGALLNEFRARYHRYLERMNTLSAETTDPIVVSRLYDDISSFSRLVDQVR